MGRPRAGVAQQRRALLESVLGSEARRTWLLGTSHPILDSVTADSPPDPLRATNDGGLTKQRHNRGQKSQPSSDKTARQTETPFPLKDPDPGSAIDLTPCP